jgi:hypothetical protein
MADLHSGYIMLGDGTVVAAPAPGPIAAPAPGPIAAAPDEEFEVSDGSLRGIDRINSNVVFDILGELAAKSPAFKQYAAKRIASSRPIVSQHPLSMARDWQIDFGPVYAATAGYVTTLTITPQVLFRGEKVMATDTGNGTASTVGYGTRITQIFVGQKSQRPANAGATLTAFFANNALGNGIRWDSCERGLSISVTVSFVLANCTFDMTVFGKAVL